MSIHTLNILQHLRQGYSNVYEHFVDTRYNWLRLLIIHCNSFISINKTYYVTFMKPTLKSDVVINKRKNYVKMRKL